MCDLGKPSTEHSANGSWNSEPFLQTPYCIDMLAEYISTWMTLPISNIVNAVVHCQFLSFNNKLVENIFGDKKSGTRITFST